MDLRTAILAVALVASLSFFGIGLFGTISAEDLRTPVIDMQEATRIVLTEFPKARILELDAENGRLVYEVELVTAEGQKKEIHVNATTGKLEKIEHD